MFLPCTTSPPLLPISFLAASTSASSFIRIPGESSKLHSKRACHRATSASSPPLSSSHDNSNLATATASMGKVGRVACIATPWALTVASFVCLVLIELGGSNKGSTELNSLYFMRANFSAFDPSAASTAANTTTLTASLELAKSEDLLRDIYEIHLWNYCSSNSTSSTIDYCSKRTSEFVFDPLVIWGLNSSSATSASTATTSGDNALQSAVASAKNNTENLENEVLGKSGKAALDAYRTVAKWMFIAYEVSFWTTLATIVVSILAIFSRWGSFLTWFFSIVSTIFTFLAVLTSTILFAALSSALHELLKTYHISVTLGGHMLAVSWLAVALSFAATFFWLFSVCCCSGASNPHHRGNKGGLWAAEPKGQGYLGRGRGLQVEKTGGYERVESPWHMGEEGDRVPLAPYPQPQQPHYQQQHQQWSGTAYEPFRRS